MPLLRSDGGGQISRNIVEAYVRAMAVKHGGSQDIAGLKICWRMQMSKSCLMGLKHCHKCSRGPSHLNLSCGQLDKLFGGRHGL